MHYDTVLFCDVRKFQGKQIIMHSYFWVALCFSSSKLW